MTENTAVQIEHQYRKFDQQHHSRQYFFVMLTSNFQLRDTGTQ